jgi:hypothetical protein
MALYIGLLLTVTSFGNKPDVEILFESRCKKKASLYFPTVAPCRLYEQVPDEKNVQCEG